MPTQKKYSHQTDEDWRPRCEVNKCASQTQRPSWSRCPERFRGESPPPSSSTPPPSGSTLHSAYSGSWRQPGQSLDCISQVFKEIGDGGVENKKEDSSVNKLSMSDEDPTMDEDDADVNIVNLKEKEGGDRSVDNTITLDTYWGPRSTPISPSLASSFSPIGGLSLTGEPFSSTPAVSPGTYGSPLKLRISPSLPSPRHSFPSDHWIIAVGQVGKVEAKLVSLGSIRGLVCGNWGEVSEDTHALLDIMATNRVSVAGPSTGKKGVLRSEEGERSMVMG